MANLFNFTTGKEVNPLKSVELAFINPYMPENARHLNLLNKVTPDEFTTTFDEKGHVINLFPIKKLELGECLIKWQTTETGIIQTVSGNCQRNIYFKIIDSVMQINTILFYKIH